MKRGFWNPAFIGALWATLATGNDLPMRDLELDHARRTYWYIKPRSQKKKRRLARQVTGYY